MTEADWLAGVVPVELGDAEECDSGLLWEQAGERKCQLYAAACARRIWHLFPDERCHRVVEALERLADGIGDQSELEAAREQMVEAEPTNDLSPAQAMAYSVAVGLSIDTDGRLADMAAGYAHAATRGSAATPSSLAERLREQQADLDLMRELLTALFRPVELPPPRIAPAAKVLAQAAYNSRHLPSGYLDQVRLAELAEELENQGCDDATLLAHFRAIGPHVRGCWALDMVLGQA